MGVDVDAKLMFGLYYEDIVQHMSEEEILQLDDEIDMGELDTASPYYDSERIYWFIGYQMGEYFDLESVDSFIEDLKDCDFKFKARFAMTGRVLAAKDVT